MNENNCKPVWVLGNYCRSQLEGRGNVLLIASGHHPWKYLSEDKPYLYSGSVLQMDQWIGNLRVETKDGFEMAKDAFFEESGTALSKAKQNRVIEHADKHPEQPLLILGPMPYNVEELEHIFNDLDEKHDNNPWLFTIFYKYAWYTGYLGISRSGRLTVYMDRYSDDMDTASTLAMWRSAIDSWSKEFNGPIAYKVEGDYFDYPILRPQWIRTDSVED